MNRKKWIRLLIPGALMALFFQNCAPSDMVFEDIELSQAASFFGYPYKSAPRFYADTLIFQQASSTDNLKTFKFFGLASYLPDASASVDYEVRFTDADIADDPNDPTANILCPTISGTLTAGTSTITPSSDCTTTKTFAKMKVVLTVEAQGVSGSETSFEKVYTK